MKLSSVDAFNALLEGRETEGTQETKNLATLAAALTPAERSPADPRFKARLRSELMAAATEAEQADVAEFARSIDTGVASQEIRPLVAVAAALEQANPPVPSASFRY